MSLGQGGALCLKSSNKGIGLENNLRVPTVHSARIPLSTTCLRVDYCLLLWVQHKVRMVFAEVPDQGTKIPHTAEQLSLRTTATERSTSQLERPRLQ